MMSTDTDHRVHPLDGMRTLAIAAVVLYHLHIPFFTGGFIGVNVFFVLSGYLITGLLMRERQRTGTIDLGKFWLRRLLRLYPALIALVLVSACVWAIVGGYQGANVDMWTAVFLAATYTSNIARWLFHSSIGVLSQTWSLAMEEQFYLIWPPILTLVLRRRFPRMALSVGLCALIITSIVLGWLLYAPRGGTATPDIYFSPILNVAPLLMGALLAVTLRSPRVTARLHGRWGVAATWAGIASLVALEVGIQSGWQRQSETFGLVLPATGLATAVLIAGVVNRTSLVSHVLSLSPIAWFGRNGSYSLYLWHVLVIALITPIIPGFGGKITAILASVAVSIACHYAVEKPFLRLKNRLEPRPVAAERPVVPAPAELQLLPR